MDLNDRIIIGSLSAPLFVIYGGEQPTPYDPTIKSITGTTAVDLVGDELEWDEITVIISYPKRMVAEVFAPKGYDGIYTADGYLFAHVLTQPDLRQVPYGTPVYYFREDALVGKFYSKRIKGTPPHYYEITAVSAVGLLDRLPHLGGVYNGQTFDVVLNDIIGGVVPFSVSTDVAALEVYNWLPRASRRSNLHQLLFSYGVAIKRDANGDMVFGFLSGDPKSATIDRIYNTGSVSDDTPATGVEVTEHSFQALSGVTPVTLFDNTDALAVTDAFIPFDQAPVFDLQTTGNLTIKSSGPNWAIVSGSGVLTGKPYTHLTRTVSVRAENTDDRTENIVRVSNITLVNRANSYNVARRLLSYYSSARTVTAELSLEGEHSGDQLAFTDPFGEAASGFLERMELSVSSNLKARCTIITDYTPKPETALFNRVDLLTVASGVYTVPPGVYLLRVAIMQAGSGGSSGTDGGEAEDSVYREEWLPATVGASIMIWEYLARKGGVGGEAGQPGDNGKVLVVDIPVTPGQKIAFTTGRPGVGAQPGAVPTAGGESTFGTYTSADGTRHPSGWQEPISGTVYALPGKAGVPGGSGSGQTEAGELIPGETITVDGTSYTPGSSYPTTRNEGRINNSIRAVILGSFGGGAAFGANGKQGIDATTQSAPSRPVVYGLLGGAGADAIVPANATKYGSGGDGGHGGGGAGAGGSVGARKGTQGAVSGVIAPAPKAAGGKASKGADGAQGAIWVYWTDPGTAQAG